MVIARVRPREADPDRPLSRSTNQPAYALRGRDSKHLFPHLADKNHCNTTRRY